LPGHRRAEQQHERDRQLVDERHDALDDQDRSGSASQTAYCVSGNTINAQVVADSTKNITVQYTATK
jgi:hypothetical protein